MRGRRRRPREPAAEGGRLRRWLLTRCAALRTPASLPSGNERGRRSRIDSPSRRHPHTGDLQSAVAAGHQTLEARGFAPRPVDPSAAQLARMPSSRGVEFLWGVGRRRACARATRWAPTGAAASAASGTRYAGSERARQPVAQARRGDGILMETVKRLR